MPTLRTRSDRDLLIGQPYDPSLLNRYDWHGYWPVVEIAPDGTVGRVEAITDGDDADLVPVDLHQVAGAWRIQRAGCQSCHAMAWRWDVEDTSVAIEELHADA